MKKAVVIREFTDKNTGKFNAVGSTIELSNDRYNELLGRKYIKEFAEIAKKEISESKPKKEKKEFS